MDGSKGEACHHHYKAFVQKRIQVIVEHTPERKLLKNGRNKGYGIKHDKHRELVNLVPFIQIIVGAKKTDVDLRNKNVDDRRENYRSNDNGQQGKPLEIIEPENGFERSEIDLDEIKRDRSKKNFYPE
jgi:hypothetical protein